MNIEIEIEWLEAYLKYKVAWANNNHDLPTRMYIAGGAEAIAIILKHLTSNSYEHILEETDEKILEEWRYEWNKEYIGEKI